MQPFKYQPKVNSGDFRNRIDVYENQRIIDELGSTTYEFVQINTLWASVVPQTGRLQRQQAETILTDVTHKIIVRHTAGKDITKDMRIHFRGHRFEIKFILNPYFKDETLEIFCQELLS